MSFRLRYHPAVAQEELPSIPSNLRRRIADAIESRLTEAPQHYGVPLRKTLKGYWKLRIGDYRVVFKIVGNEVRILAIRHRKQIYQDIVRRMKRADQRGKNGTWHPFNLLNVVLASYPRRRVSRFRGSRNPVKPKGQTV